MVHNRGKITKVTRSGRKSRGICILNAPRMGTRATDVGRTIVRAATRLAGLANMLVLLTTVVTFYLDPLPVFASMLTTYLFQMAPLLVTLPLVSSKESYTLEHWARILCYFFNDCKDIQVS
jgi:hypothetical protein